MKQYTGVYGGAQAWLISKLFEQHQKIVILSPKRQLAEEIYQDLAFFLPNVPLVQLVPWDTLPFENVSPQIEISAQRLNALNTLIHCKEYICVVPVDGAMQKVLPSDFCNVLSFPIKKGDVIPRNDLLQKIDNAGYQRVSLVEHVGDCAVRGGVIDIFPPNELNPLRLEFFADTVEKIKTFSPVDQRSLNKINECYIIPAREIVPFHNEPHFKSHLATAINNIKQLSKDLETPLREVAKVINALKEGTHYPGIELATISALGNMSNIFEYISKDTFFISLDKQALEFEFNNAYDLIRERYNHIAEEHSLIPNVDDMYLSPDEFNTKLNGIKHQAEIGSLYLATNVSNDNQNVINIKSSPNTELVSQLQANVGHENPWSPLKNALSQWKKNDFKVAFVIGSPARIERLQNLLKDLSIDADTPKISIKHFVEHKTKYPLVILEGSLSSGFQIPKEKLVLIAEQEIFPRRSQRTGKSASERTIKKLLNSLSQLKNEDYIVHEDYGVGIYHGLVHKTVENIQCDFLHIEYADSQLYIPIQKITKVQKYVGVEGQTPVLDKLSSQRWNKTKLKVREAVLALAGDLIKLYASRTLSKGYQFEKENYLDEQFADSFEFDETPDQLSAIKSVLNDMASDKPMDRLICGDVGFGKTEVAIRAAFKCAIEGKQVCILVPTTVLVEQHLQSFQQRFSGYPIKVAAMSRFHSNLENKKTIEALANHKVDIVIGTHKLLQKNIAFADLGLLIIDEEHRFGVQQKERLKKLKKQVDVLALTATPIPRTLQMSLLNIRDISVITTPPVDRRVIKTYIATRNETLIRDALIREHQRGGQAFFVHNRVESIFGIGAALSQLVPEMKIECAHGQMSETQLENIMRRFINHEIDVLVCTTIIESGLDIPNANTIIIDRADTFGLAQLYQLRGRVGRNNKQAYAYFLIPNLKRLGIEAQKRLKVLQSLDDLGIGFNLAIRDLEIRGAGNLLGKEQSGHVLNVGYELYSKILKEAVTYLKGEELSVADTIDPEVKLPINAFIPEYYIPDISERLVLYQRLASISSSEEADDLYAELEDRFGTLPPEARNMVEIMRIRSLLRKYGVVEATWSREKMYLAFSHNARLDIEKILKLERTAPKKYKLTKNLTLAIQSESKELPPFEQLYNKLETLLKKLV